ncbi:pPIWI-associating nuclease domain-containing protein [Vibrio parahaemolyticus]|uniref:pPIWI-associating nuclease domain-containing protein n=1 Tax=Vibrio parahaemolyticus TaxID=670 RepID=UPI001D166307|nr:hypothetical protein [Vibrio parahaemolyticus]MCC3798697.1 hypothetical protein [Vibrio parahaemolyticus]MCC3813584.1 hypothetical protein [Vibrio parahaemolyticus]
MKLKKLLQHDFIQAFESLLVTPFEKELFIASLRNYCSHGNPLRFHNFAFSMRELVLHIIARRAPIEEVKKTNWYEKEHEKFDVTRRQQLKFCAQGYLSDQFFTEADLEDLNYNIKFYLKKFNFFNKYTHITEKHLKPNPKQFYTDMKFIIEFSQEVVEQLESWDSIVISAVENRCHEQIFQSVINNFPDDLMILANNVIIEEIHPEELDIIVVSDEHIEVSVNGTVYVSQEYGKGEDFTEMANDYPFTISLEVSVDDPSDITVNPSSIEVDTSSWFE